MNKEVLIIGGGLLQQTAIKVAKEMGLKTIVTDFDPNCICSQQADKFHAIDIFDVEKHIQLALNIKHVQKRNLVAVFVEGIEASFTGACVAKVLGLPGVSPLTAYIADHKYVTRLFLEKAGIPCPRFAEVQNFEEAKKAAEKIKYPLIVKNVDNSASRGTTKLMKENDELLKTAVESAIEASKTRTALMEELMIGEEQTVETIFDIEGNFHPCFITDRHFKGEGNNAIETGLENPTTLSLEMQEKLYALAKKAGEAIGINIGACKLDTMTTKGGPRIIEMTTRLSGGFDCQYLVPAATGKEVIKAALLTAMGEKFDKKIIEDTKKRVGVTGSLWPKPGKIVEIKGVEEALKIPGAEHIFMRYKKGDEVKEYDDCAKRVAFLIATGSTRKEAYETLEKMKKTIRVVTK